MMIRQRQEMYAMMKVPLTEGRTALDPRSADEATSLETLAHETHMRGETTVRIDGVTAELDMLGGRPALPQNTASDDLYDNFWREHNRFGESCVGRGSAC